MMMKITENQFRRRPKISSGDVTASLAAYPSINRWKLQRRPLLPRLFNLRMPRRPWSS